MLEQISPRASCVSRWIILSTKGSLPHCSALGERPELGPLGAMAPLLDARTAHGGACARIEKRRLGLFVAGPEEVRQPVTPAVADDSPSPHRHHDPVRTC